VCAPLIKVPYLNYACTQHLTVFNGEISYVIQRCCPGVNASCMCICSSASLFKNHFAHIISCVTAACDAGLLSSTATVLHASRWCRNTCQRHSAVLRGTSLFVKRWLRRTVVKGPSPSLTSLVVNEARMRPGHWCGSVLWHCWLGDTYGIQSVKTLLPLILKGLSSGPGGGRRPTRNWLTQVHLENVH